MYDHKSYNLVTYNVAAISESNKKKCRNIFTYFKILGFPDILTLVDTRKNTTNKEFWAPNHYIKIATVNKNTKTKWPSKGISNYYNKNLEPKLLYKDNDGDILATSVTIQSEKTLHISLYRPNFDEDYFFKNKLNYVLKRFSRTCQNIIINGDFNLFFEKERDSSNYVKHNYPKARKALKYIMDEYKIVDIASMI